VKRRGLKPVMEVKGCVGLKDGE